MTSGGIIPKPKIGTDGESRPHGGGHGLSAVALVGLLSSFGGALLLWAFDLANIALIFAGSGLLITSIGVAIMLGRPDGNIPHLIEEDFEALSALVAMNRRALILTDLSGRPIAGNDAYEKVAGGRMKRVETMVWGDEARDGVAAMRLKVKAGGETSGQFPFNSERTATIVLSVNRKGERLIWTVSRTGIEVRMENVVRAIQDMPLVLNEYLGLGIAVVDQNGTLRFANPILRDWLGLDLDADLPEKIRFRKNDTQMVRSDRRSINVSISRTDVPTREGDAVLGHYVLVRNMEEQRRIDGVAGDGDIITPFLDGAPMAVVLVDEYRLVQEYNQATKRVAPDSNVKRGSDVLKLVHEEDRSELAERIDVALSGRSPKRPADVRFNVQGERVGQIFLTAIKTDSGNCAVLYLMDTTQHKSLERQFVQAQKMQAVGQLAGGVAHDFNNLLTAIIGFCDLLLVRHDSTDQSFADINQIRQNANRAANLVRQLLAFSRQQTLRPKVLMVTDVIAELTSLLRRLIGETIDLKVVHGRDLRPVKVDQGQLEQVIINLAVNARDAMENGGTLEIRTKMVAADDPLIERFDVINPDDYVLIEVEDTGCGIDSDIMAKIFEPFFTTKVVGQGTGLGLATVYGIVKQTGGYVFADSTIGKGTTFMLFLKAHTLEKSDVLPATKLEVDVVARDLTGKGTILIVEDEDPVRMFASRALSNKGYKVLEAASGETGLEILQQHKGPIDLIISDVVMPNMDGPTLATKARELYPSMPIIFISGYAEDVFRKNLQSGNFHFLPKPFSLQKLAEQVKNILG